MAYSNITPPTLPEYESALYPHYVLEFEYENGSENWFAVSLRYSSTPFTYDGAAVTNAGEHHLQTYGSGNGEWTYWGTLTEMSIAPGTTSTGGYRRIWTNHNILDGSGNVWLAANTATPAEANQDRLSIMKSKLAGLIMAWCAPVRQFPQREPVAFLYGHVAKEGETPTHTINGVGYVGVVAPKLPEWDTEKYRYACIKSTTTVGLYGLLCSQHPLEGTENDFGKFAAPSVYPNSCLWFTSTTTGWDLIDSDLNASFSSGYIWSNCDVLNSNGDGKVAFSATDPIPIYE